MIVAEVARVKGISQRTVERDIASGILPARKTPKGRLRILARDVRTYRRRNRLRGDLLPAEYARLIGVSVNTVRRWITIGKLRPVIVSPRQMFITEAEHRRVFQISFERAALIAKANVLAALLAKASGRRLTSATRHTVRPGVLTAPQPGWLTVADVARLARTMRVATTRAAIDRDIAKGVIPTIEHWANGKPLIPRAAAEQYLGLTVAQLALRAGTTPAAINRYLAKAKDEIPTIQLSKNGKRLIPRAAVEQYFNRKTRE